MHLFSEEWGAVPATRGEQSPRRPVRATILGWSRPIDVHRWSDHLATTAALDQVYQEIVELRRRNGGRLRDPKELRKHLRILLLDLFVAALENPPWSRHPLPRWIGVPRAKASYGAEVPTRYKKLFLSYRHVTGVLDDLLQLGYAKQVAGFYDRKTGIGRQTRVRARSKLVRLMLANKVTTEIIHTSPNEVIVLRDAGGQEVEYVDTEETNSWRENLERINGHLAKLRIRPYIKDEEFRALNARMARDPERGIIDYRQNQLKRIFNNSSFREGGRFYGGWWQNVPAEYRKYLEINHKQAIEVDYSGLHIRMLYALEGIAAPDDPYDVEGIDRDIQKKAVLVMVNASDEQAALRSFTRDGFRYVESGVLFAKMRSRHERIKHHFFTGMGVQLQYLDSCIAEQVMLKMLERHIGVLPVHDSFLVRVGSEHELEEAMEEAFTRQFPGTQPRLKAKKTALEEAIRGREDFVSDDIEGLLKGYSKYHFS